MISRMPQRSRTHLPHLAPFRAAPIVFLTATTHHRQRILASDRAHTALRKIWTRSAEYDGWIVGRYVLMPDHVHLFAMPEAGAVELHDWIRMWKSVSARQLGPAPVWQRDYFDRFLRSEESYSEKWQYVRQNPVRAGLVESADAWPYGGEIHELEWTTD